jgi:hypothetical protein
MRRASMVNSAVSGLSSTAYTGSTRLLVVLVKIKYCHVRELWKGASRPRAYRMTTDLGKSLRPQLAALGIVGEAIR